MNISRWFVVGALFGLGSVALGSLGAHALKEPLLVHNSAPVFGIAKDYLGYHGLVLMILAMVMEKWPSLPMQRSAQLIAIGAFLFSSSLFTFAITGIKWFAHVAPVGGGTMVLGWLWLTWVCVKNAR